MIFMNGINLKKQICVNLNNLNNIEIFDLSNLKVSI